MPAFTRQSPSLLTDGPIFEIRIAMPAKLETLLRTNNIPVPAPINIMAMIDTGASHTVIKEDAIAPLKINPVGSATISTPSSTGVQCDMYKLRLLLPNNIVTEMAVIAAPLQGQHVQFLIGRDLLQHGVLVYIGQTNTFTLSF